MFKIKSVLLFLLFILLVYTRFVNLSWGLPYPMHPDERNMANAIQLLSCDPDLIGIKFQISNCFNPHFFAYGQLPLYLGFAGVLLSKFFAGDLGTPISFEEAAFSLRLISAISSILNVFILLKLVKLLISNNQVPSSKQLTINNYQIPIAFIFFIFSPFFIQFSHLGTTESLLMLLYSLIIYISIKFTQNKLSSSNFLFLTSIFSGIAIATKISSVLFLVVPIALIIDQVKDTILLRSVSIWYLLALTLVLSIFFSPHNFISFVEFLGSMKYESDVALGTYRAFYTRQFEGAIPVLFQFVKIFPNTLGWPAFIFFILGFIFLPYKIEFNLLRLAILGGFLPSAFLYAKWTRFMSPILPFMLLMAILFVFRVISMKMEIYKIRQFVWIPAFAGMTMLMMIPGIAYLSIYQNPDVRFTASEWIFKNIPSGSYILSETANVVDLPISPPSVKPPDNNYQYISFNFYDLDENPELPALLQAHLTKANHIFIPSRRIFANHYCPTSLSFRGSAVTEKSIPTKSGVILRFARFLSRLSRGRNDMGEDKCQYLRKKYPKLNNYYDKLFSGELGFEKVAEFSSYPKIQFFGKTILELPDEDAEETWTVFDHPVFRIYKRVNL